MSPVYWGIVLGLVALVATMFVCIELVYSGQRSPKAPSGRIDEPSEAAAQASPGHRQAA